MRNPREEHLYIYAAVAGRPGPRVVSQLPAMPDGSRPRVLPLNVDVSLIVADVSSATYNASSLEGHLADLDWVSRCGAAHHAVSDALSDSHVVLPFRLFTVFSTEAKALTTLHKTRPRLVKALDRVRGRKEWVLRIGKPDPSRVPARLRPRTAASTQSGTSFLRGKADARREETERAARATTDAANVFDALRAIADASAARPTAPATNLLMDAAFLVSTRRAAMFQKTLSRAAEGLLRDGCPVSLTGPWPPYSFATLD